MSEAATERKTVEWGQWGAFPELARTFRMAIHPASLLLCFVGLAASFWIAVGLDQVPGLGQTQVEGRSLYQNLYVLGTEGLWGNWALPYIGGKTWDDFFTFVMTPLATGRQFVALVIAYWQEAWLFALVNTVVGVAIWAWIGGAVARMAAVRFAREESVPLKKALAFSCRKWLSFAASPLIPFVALVFVGILTGALTGVPLSLFWRVGEVIVPLLFGLTLIGGLLMALIFIGGAFSVGLQWPTIAAEGSDAFDAISRSVAYISSRPWRYLWYTIYTAIYGCLTFIFVKFVGFLMLWLTHHAVTFFSWGWGDKADKLVQLWAEPTWAYPWPRAGADALVPGAELQHWTEAFGSVVILIFVWIAFGLMVAFLLSFCLNAQTIIYFLLRRSVDATDIEEVYVEEAEEEALPVEHKVEPAEKAPEEGGPAPEAGQAQPGGEAEPEGQAEGDAPKPQA
jgi:hypothetical protein